jgi:glutamine---fructose-6-phosphate transaminase (isomerizing)
MCRWWWSRRKTTSTRRPSPTCRKSRRGGQIILISNGDGKDLGCTTRAVCQLPDVGEMATPLVYAVPVQLLAYHTAFFMGTDVDQPRNLAKSVTVE